MILQEATGTAVGTGAANTTQLYLHKGQQKHLMQQDWQGHMQQEDIPIGFYPQKMN